MIVLRLRGPNHTRIFSMLTMGLPVALGGHPAVAGFSLFGMALTRRLGPSDGHTQGRDFEGRSDTSVGLRVIAVATDNCTFFVTA